MKTSQEIAEEMAFRAANESSMTMLGPEPNFVAIMQEIPLTQLIEVARAARTMQKVTYPEDRIEAENNLIIAMMELIQTGKAEWL